MIEAFTTLEKAAKGMNLIINQERPNICQSQRRAMLVILTI